MIAVLSLSTTARRALFLRKPWEEIGFNMGRGNFQFMQRFFEAVHHGAVPGDIKHAFVPVGDFTLNERGVDASSFTGRNVHGLEADRARGFIEYFTIGDLGSGAVRVEEDDVVLCYARGVVAANQSVAQIF